MNGINNQRITAEIKKEITIINDTSKITSKQVFILYRRRGSTFMEGHVNKFKRDKSLIQLEKQSVDLNMIKTYVKAAPNQPNKI